MDDSRGHYIDDMYIYIYIQIHIVYIYLCLWRNQNKQQLLAVYGSLEGCAV